MKLYHGTSESAVTKILSQGFIKPRGKGRGNWKHTVDSNPDAIYLTDAYAIYFAGNAAKLDKNERLAVIEIDTEKLNPFWMAPDEDFLEQATRKQAGENLAPTNKPMKFRTRWYRKRLLNFTPSWQLSLEHMGNCTYHNHIPTSAITRIAFIEPDAYARMIWMAGLDPMITIMNYRIMGLKYRNSIKQLFHDPITEEDDFSRLRIDDLPEDQKARLLEEYSKVWTKGVEVKAL